MRGRAGKRWPDTAYSARPEPLRLRPPVAASISESAGPEAIASGPEQHLPQVSETGYPTSAEIAPDWISSTVVAMSTSR